MSSKSEEITYTCPYCKKTFPITIYNSVHADEDPDLRDRCVSGDLFRYSCPHCKKDYMVQYPLVYSDREHKFVLWLCPKEASMDLRKQIAPLLAQGYTLRRCETIQEFCEKIEILEDGVSDIAVELAKYDSFIEFIDNKKGKREDITSIEYQYTKDDVMKINIRTEDRGMSFLIPVSAIQAEMDQHPDRYQIDNSQFPVVNSTWIIDLFEESAGQA